MSTSRAAARHYWHVLVCPRTPALDGHGREVLLRIRQIGLEHIEAVRSARLFLFAGRLDESHVRRIADHLLVDPVGETVALGRGLTAWGGDLPLIEVHALPGVMDPTALSTLEASRRLLGEPADRGTLIDEVRTARRYEIIGATCTDDLEQVASRVLANDCIETCFIRGFGREDALPQAFPTPPRRAFALRTVPMRKLSDDELAKLSRESHLFLSVEEMRAIRGRFDELERDPTDLELETLAQTWSEHCVHKTLKSAIRYRGEDFGRSGDVETSFGNLLADTIAAATRRLDRPWCLSVFEDNAGVIALDDDYGIAFKVETHNHPSALEPYGGAATGVGGCIRDIMGCGLGAKPIASTDVFCLGPPGFDATRLPTGVHDPVRTLRGVVAGVRDYGNRMGIPTVNGAVHFDERFVANPLVYCGCVGLIPRKFIAKQPKTGDRIVLAGGRTGRDGIHGATFSSAELTDSHADEFSHAVQIGHAIEEKKLLDAMLRARNHADGCLYSAVTDCGAGGLSSAVGEMGEKLGATVELETVPLKYAGLRYDEIWISEAQERMVFAVPPDRLDAMLAVFAEEEVEATVIGTFTDDGVLRVRYESEVVGELPMDFLHGGRPRQTLTATWRRPRDADRAEAKPVGAENRRSAHERLLSALRDPNTASKEWIIRQYDHEVQGRSVVKPLVGPGNGPSDAAVLRPLYDRARGIALGCGLCLELSDVDPYWMAVAAVDEALRNVVCVGADPQRTAILDNFCWPKVDSEESLGALVRACVGAHDAALSFGLPFISGKDSLNNEYTMSPDEAARTGLPQHIAIPYTLLISAVGIVKDVTACVSMDLKQPGDRLVLASAPVVTVDALRGDVDRDRVLAESHAMHVCVARLIRDGCVRAAHDVSDGGAAGAIAEMCIAANLGAIVRFDGDLTASSVFERRETTYLLEMSERDAEACGLPIVGEVRASPVLRMDVDGLNPIEVPVKALAEAWRSPLAEGGGRDRA